METARDILRDVETSTWVKMGGLWLASAFHFANDNLPSIIGWLTAFYTVLQIGLAIRKYFAKPTS